MKWVNHIAIAGACAVAVNPLYVPAAVAGAVAPDAAERFLPGVAHRGPTHYVVVWAGASLLFLLLPVLDYHVAVFALGGLSHCLTDALTVSGVPFSPMSPAKFHLFGGRLRTGGAGEYIISGVFLLVAFGVYSVLHKDGGGFLPFFYDWPEYYRSGLVDGAEWKANRFKFF